MSECLKKIEENDKEKWKNKEEQNILYRISFRIHIEASVLFNKSDRDISSQFKNLHCKTFAQCFLFLFGMK